MTTEEARWRAAWEVAYGRHEHDFQEPVLIHDDKGTPPRHGGYRCACGDVCWVRGKSIFSFKSKIDIDPMTNLQAAVRRYREEGRRPFVPHLVRCTCGAKGVGALGIVYEHADGCPAGEPGPRRQAADHMRAVDSQGRTVHDFGLAAGDVASRILKDAGITQGPRPGAYLGPQAGPNDGFPPLPPPVTIATFDEYVKLFGPSPPVDWAAVAERLGLPPYAPSRWERIGDRVSIWQWRRRLDAAQLLWRLGRPRAERLASWIVQDPSA